MSEPQQKANGSETELGAGALVWSRGAEFPEARVAIVHRPAPRNDWVLPKGHIDIGESVETAALREAGEETGVNLSAAGFAGTYRYTGNGKPRLILVWHAHRVEGAFPAPAPPGEIDQVEWLPPTAAAAKLSYESERDFLRRHAMPPAPTPAVASTRKPRSIEQAKRDRIDARIATTTERLQSAVAERARDFDNFWWAESAQRSLHLAAAAAERGELDRAWSMVHDAERVLVFALTDAQLVARATTLSVELGAKLRDWRKDAVATLFNNAKLGELRRAGKPLDREQRTNLQFAMIESLSVFNEDTDNFHHRVGLISERMQTMVKICASLLATLIAGSLVGWWLGGPIAETFPPSLVFTVILSGALGGSLSTLFQLSRIGRMKIPDALLHGLLVVGRPLIGAASAVFIVAVYRSGIVAFIDNQAETANGLFVAAVLGFLAGLSEKFVMGTATRISTPKEQSAKSDES